MIRSPRKLIHNNRLTYQNMWDDKYFETIACPLCASKKKMVLYPKHYPRIVQCCSCKFIYTNPRLKKKYLQKLYGQEYFNNINSSLLGYSNYIKDKEKTIKTFKKRLKTIETIKKIGKLLDVGCATGFFMKVAQDHGWQTEGVEISEFATKYARETFSLTIHQADFQNLRLEKKSYDVITLWDVIEHVSDPIATLKKTHSLLKDNGLLVFSTPDVGSLPARLTRHRWVGYKLCDEHLSYLSLQTITALCRKSGFQITNTHHLGKYVSFSLFADRIGLYSTVIGNLLKMIDRIIPKSFHFYISAFDIICVYAKKSSF